MRCANNHTGRWEAGLLLLVSTFGCGQGAGDESLVLSSGDNGPVAETCPPVSPFGTSVNDVTVDVELPDCDGALHSLHGLCTNSASWVFSYAGW